MDCEDVGRAHEPVGERRADAGASRQGSLWVALATHPHKEQVALDNLERQGFSVYGPKMRKIVRHARRSQEVLRPFFPGYVFARFGSTGSRWRSMASTIGVRRVISFGDRPCLLGEDFIVSLKAREVDGALMKPATPYKIGQSVCLTSGAFEGLIATIIEMDEKQRLVVLLDLLNQSVRVRTGYAGVREL
jgi:transcriptional antiterminator RfaH